MSNYNLGNPCRTPKGKDLLCFVSLVAISCNRTTKHPLSGVAAPWLCVSGSMGWEHGVSSSEARGVWADTS